MLCAQSLSKISRACSNYQELMSARQSLVYHLPTLKTVRESAAMSLNNHFRLWMASLSFSIVTSLSMGTEKTRSNVSPWTQHLVGIGHASKPLVVTWRPPIWTPWHIVTIACPTLNVIDYPDKKSPPLISWWLATWITCKLIKFPPRLQ